ncbi:MAG: hypothetical protein DYG89_18230 [Caldilinea sp. CFX5]|nr:hypothetical protein [Caldilinea sp. CFX5]
MALRPSESSFQPNHQWTTAQLELTVLAVQPVLTPSINPPQNQPAEPSDLYELAVVLARLYPDTGNQQRLLFYIELEQAAVNFDKSAVEVWLQIAKVAYTAGVFAHLTTVALSEYPQNPTLINALQEITVPASSKSLSARRLTIRHLITAFARLYNDTTSMRRVVEDAGIDSAYINFSGSPLVAWYRIFARVNITNQIDDLLTIAASEYGANQQLSQAIVSWQKADRAHETTNSDGAKEIPDDLVKLSVPEQIAAVIKRLGRVFAFLYPDQSSQRRVVYDADLPIGLINFNGTTIDVWIHILDEAEKHDKVENLLAVATEEYGGNRDLAEAQALWQAATDGLPQEPMRKIETKAA